MTIPELQQMKRDGRKIVGVVAWDYQIARIADRAGVDIISVGDTVGINLWGHATPLEVTMDEMVLVCRAVRRGTQRALVSCDFPFGPLQEGVDSAVRAAIRLVKEAGADMVKLDGAADFPDAVRAIARAGIPVFAQFGITPQTALQYGLDYGAMSKAGAEVPAAMTDRLVAGGEACSRTPALRCSTSPTPGPSPAPRSTRAVSIPVIGGFGGGPWLDGRVRMAHAAIGYAASALDATTENYANVARITLDALGAYADDVRCRTPDQRRPAGQELERFAAFRARKARRTASCRGESPGGGGSA